MEPATDPTLWQEYRVAILVAASLAVMGAITKFFGRRIAGVVSRRLASRRWERIAPWIVEAQIGYTTHLRDVTKTFGRARTEAPEKVRERARREILEPIRGYLPTAPGEEIKIVWFRPHEDRIHLAMYEQVGHTEEGQAALRLRIGGSLAGKAFADCETLYRDKCEDDPLFQDVEQTKAHGSLACMPIMLGGKATGVLSVLSSWENAFWLSEITYFEALAASLGSIETLIFQEGAGLADT